jgi:hypothetical protein
MSENSYNDLVELQKYMKDKYNINVKLNKINKKKNTSYNIQTINEVYKKLSILIILTILFIIILCFLSFNKKFNKMRKIKIINIIFYVTIVYIVFNIIWFFQKYLFMIYLYNKNNDKIENESIDINNINFESGDILQELANWNFNYGFFIYLFNIEFFHNLFIIKFNNKNYAMHYTLINYGYPENYLSIGKHLEIFKLEDYLKDNYNSVKNYRVLQYRNKLDNNELFKFFKKIENNDMKFSFIPCLKNCDNNYYYNCMSFILRILNDLNIIPNFNKSTFTSNDAHYLVNLSKNSYKEPFIMKVNP